MAAVIRPFGTTLTGESVDAIRLQAGELTAVVLTLGAILQDLRLAGAPYSLTLGSDLLAAYAGPMAYCGAIVGPVANRIGGAAATIAGRDYRFAANEGPNLLHSGATGTHARVWSVIDATASEVTLRLTLADGLGGLPGVREITAVYALAGSSLTLTLSAATDAPTLMNLASHGYWTMDGRADIRGQRLRVAADRYLPVDAALLPTGEARAVAGVFDLRDGRSLDLTEGFDHNFCLSDAVRPLAFAADLTGESGVRMTLETTEPGLQVYDGRGLNTAPFPGHAGQPYGRCAGLALEPQRWPDAAAHPGFPPITLAPGQVYRQVTRFSFDRV
ncbi:MAG: galactose mutarotase [Rhodobacteraceae bacterium]|nr:galactose mutarotase [Paracoccaceae bacterium]